jgi:hypothetical protein
LGSLWEPEVSRGSPRSDSAEEQIRRNLLLLVVLGVFISGWILFYTDLFPIVGGLLGLGGLFAWLAFLSGLLTEARKKALQERFEAGFLASGKVGDWLLIGLAGLCLLASGAGAIRLDASGDGENRVVRFRVLDRESSLAVGWRHYVTGRSTGTFPLPASWLGQDYVVDVAGLPDRRIRVFPFVRRRLVTPEASLERPVLLIRPMMTISAQAEASDFTLDVHVDDRKVGDLAQYRGEPVWIGCDEDVAIPQRVLERWRLDLILEDPANYKPESFARWTAPMSVVPQRELSAGETVRVRVLRPNGTQLASVEVSVKKARSDGLPQTAVLKIP